VWSLEHPEEDEGLVLNHEGTTLEEILALLPSGGNSTAASGGNSTAASGGDSELRLLQLAGATLQRLAGANSRPAIFQEEAPALAYQDPCCWRGRTHTPTKPEA
jgi:hypothetical protein